MKEADSLDETVFNAALHLSDPRKQSAYLDLACAGNPELRQRVERLLRAGQKAKDFFLQHAGNVPVDSVHTVQQGGMSEGIGSVIDRYKLLQRIGEGGCGIVYMAEQ